MTCAIHGGTKSYCNLSVIEEDDDIVLHPHVTGACVLVFTKAEAAALFDFLGELLS
ncbi:MAG: hypothetical protein ACRDRA_07225 [Pseudonocardiaceae bacterium]